MPVALPADWADGSKPLEVFDLPKEWPALRRRYACFRESKPLQAIWKHMRDVATSAMLEREYIDADYRDEYAHFYAQTFRQMPDRCERVHFLRDAEYLGYVSLRPLTTRPVSRTMLQPPPSLRAHIACLTEGVAQPFQTRQAVQAFPFMSQDAHYGVCAHAAIWMVALYYHLAYQRPRFFISDIVEAANKRAEIHRVTPTDGMSPQQMGTAFRELGMSAFGYDVADFAAAGNVEELVLAYLNSRFPVVVISDDHATVLIGCGQDDKTEELFWIRQDDSSEPYARLSNWRDDPRGQWRMLMVPTPGRIYLSADLAETKGRVVLDYLSQGYGAAAAYDAAALEETFRVRTYATLSSSYKQELALRGYPPDVVNLLARVTMSNWIWVLELQDRVAAQKGRRCVSAELAIDATSSPDSPNLLAATFPGASLVWRGGAPEPEEFGNKRKASALVESGAPLHIAR